MAASTSGRSSVTIDRIESRRSWKCACWYAQNLQSVVRYGKKRLGKVFEFASGPFALVAAKTCKEDGRQARTREKHLHHGYHFHPENIGLYQGRPSRNERCALLRKLTINLGICDREIEAAPIREHTTLHIVNTLTKPQRRPNAVYAVIPPTTKQK